MLRIKSGDKILFTGDSITDCGCSASGNINFLGHGYPVFIAALLGARRPELELTFVNTGVSGHRVSNLKARWDRDVINHKPDIVSILVGINDAASRYSRNLPISAFEFEAEYRSILEKTRSELPGVRIVLMEPFVLPLPEDRRLWRDDLDKKLQVVRDLAAELGDALIPLDGIFNTAACRREKSFWAPDGVHPTPAGHALIAESWISSVSF